MHSSRSAWELRNGKTVIYKIPTSKQKITAINSQVSFEEHHDERGDHPRSSATARFTDQHPSFPRVVV